MIRFLFHAENRNFLRLFLAQLISQFGDRINQLALVGLIAERTAGSAMDLAKVMAFTIVPVFIIQPFAGVLVDRWDRKWTLLLCDCGRGLLVLTIPFLFIARDSMIPIYCVVFLAFSFSRFYVPAKMSFIPQLVKDEHLLMANSLVTTTGMIAFVLGCALGGYLIEEYGAKNGFIIDAATFFVSGVFLANITLRKRLDLSKINILATSKEIMEKVKTSFWEEMHDGFLYLIQHKEIRFIINVIFTVMAAAGAIYVVLIVFIQQSFGSITKDLGVLAVCLGIGLFSGVLFYGKFGKKVAWYKTIFYCLIAGGAMLIIFTTYVNGTPNMVVAMGLAGMMGFITGPIFIASNTVIHLVSEEKMRGKVFAAIEIVIHFAFLVSMLISSWLSGFIEEAWILTGVGVVFSLLGVVGLVRSRKQGFLALDEDNVA